MVSPFWAPCPPQAGCWRSYLDRRPYISWIRLGRGNCSPSHFQASAGRGFPSRVKRMASRTADGLAPYAGPHSKGLARAEFLLAPSFVVRPPAAKHFDRQRSGGQIAGEGLGSADGLRTQRAGRIIGMFLGPCRHCRAPGRRFASYEERPNHRLARFYRRESGASAPVRRHVREPR